MSVLELIAGVLIYTACCTIQGILGFGAGLLGVPMLALVSTDFVPVPILMSAPLMGGMFAWRERDAIDGTSLRWGVIGLIPGVTLGALTLTAVDKESLDLLFGSLLLAAVCLKASGARTKRNPWTVAFGGSMTGFMGTTVGVGGPPMALVMSDVSAPIFRSTMNAFMMIGMPISVLALAIADEIVVSDLVVSAFLVLSILVGFAISGPLRRFLDHGWLAPAVLAMSGLGAVCLLVRSLV